MRLKLVSNTPKRTGNHRFHSHCMNLSIPFRTHRPASQAKHVRLISDIPSDLPDIVIGDPTRCAQVLTNLVSNAVKFTPKGKITLAVWTETESAEDQTPQLPSPISANTIQRYERTVGADPVVTTVSSTSVGNSPQVTVNFLVASESLVARSPSTHHQLILILVLLQLLITFCI